MKVGGKPPLTDFPSAFTFGLSLALVTFPFAFALALSFGLTFGLDNSVNLHVVRASVPGFLRAQVTLDRLYHFLVVGANFLLSVTEDVPAFCGGASSISVAVFTV